MTNRREFLQTGVSVSALPLALNGLLGPGVAAARISQDRLPVSRAVFDDRYAEGRAFADAIAGFGVPLSALADGDVTALWDELDRLWRGATAAIAGSTQYGPMLALEQLAGRRGMRVVLRVEHQPRADGTFAHVITGPPETMAMAARLETGGVAWPVLTAALLTHCRGKGSARVEQTIRTHGAGPVLTRQSSQSGPSRSGPESVIHYYTPRAIQQGQDIPWDGPLFSWLIAPRA